VKTLNLKRGRRLRTNSAPAFAPEPAAPSSSAAASAAQITIRDLTNENAEIAQSKLEGLGLTTAPRTQSSEGTSLFGMAFWKKARAADRLRNGWCDEHAIPTAISRRAGHWSMPVSRTSITTGQSIFLSVAAQVAVNTQAMPVMHLRVVEKTVPWGTQQSGGSELHFA
jgi:hypothetical protein